MTTFSGNARSVCALAVGFALGMTLRSEPAAAWGDEGHMAVATIAFRQLTPALQAEVRQILAGDTVGTACGAGSFVEDAVWPDKLRERPAACASTEKWGNTSPWHFLDIPVEDAAYDHQRECANDDCVVAKIKDFQKLLADKTESAPRRRDALKFLVHFVGDLHQPLHTTSAPFNRANAQQAAQMGAKKPNRCLEENLPMDRGGNCVDVRYNADPASHGSGKATELHAYWDSDVVVAISEDPQVVADKAMQGISPLDIKAMQQGTLEDWTNEGHQVAVKVVYGELPAGPMPQLQGPYTANAVNVARVQIRRGGVRLAKVIEDALK
jgi:S1/P1 Nuclease